MRGFARSDGARRSARPAPVRDPTVHLRINERGKQLAPGMTHAWHRREHPASHGVGARWLGSGRSRVGHFWRAGVGHFGERRRSPSTSVRPGDTPSGRLRAVAPPSQPRSPDDADVDATTRPGSWRRLVVDAQVSAETEGHSSGCTTTTRPKPTQADAARTMPRA
jgi:hypothetical protein